MGEDPTTRSSVMTADVQALAGAYAEGLLDYLAGVADAAPVADELDAVAALAHDTPGAAGLFAMPMSVSDRCEMVRRVFADRVSRPVLALLSVMARRGRLGLLGAVACECRRMLDARKGRIEVTVTTALELTGAQRRRLCDDIGKTFNARPVLTARVDPDVLGGAVIRVGEVVYDASLASGLATFGRELFDRLAVEAPRPDPEAQP